MPSGAILVSTADHHVNDTVGLAPTWFHRDDGGQQLASREQLALWHGWQDFWQYVADRKKALGWPVYHLAAGDIGDVNRHSGMQLVSQNEADIKKAMEEVFALPCAVADYNFIIRGTEAHSGGSGQLEESFAQSIGAEKDPDSGNFSWWVFKGELAGVTVEAAHHPPCGGRQPDRIGIAAANAARTAVLRAVRNGEKRAQLYIWAHLHRPAFGYELGAWAYILPAWKWVGAYGFRGGSSGHVEPAGGCIFELKDGQILNGGGQAFRLYRPPRRTVWKTPQS